MTRILSACLITLVIQLAPDFAGNVAAHTGSPRQGAQSMATGHFVLNTTRTLSRMATDREGGYWPPSLRRPLLPVEDTEIRVWTAGRHEGETARRQDGEVERPFDDEGRLMALRPDSLFLARPTDTLRFSRKDVARIDAHVLAGNQNTGMFIGALTGLALGIYFVASDPARSPECDDCLDVSPLRHAVVLAGCTLGGAWGGQVAGSFVKTRQWREVTAEQRE